MQFAPSTVVAQCEPSWLPGLGCPGVDGEVIASVAWDPDGNGPAPLDLIVAGDFRLAGTIRCGGLARCDLNTGLWSALAPEVFSRITALALLPNGDLVAAGEPASSAGSGTFRVARWNGSWSWLGGDFNWTVHTLHVTPAGQLFAGGPFHTVGGQPIGGIARWNGSSWLPLGSGLQGSGGVGWAMTMVSLPSGDLLVAGLFHQAGGVPVANVARWNGNAWFAAGAGLPGPVFALARTPNGLLLAGGDFTLSTGGQSASGLAVWNGATFAPVFGLSFASASPPVVRALLPLPGGRVVVAGFLRVTGSTIQNLAMLDVNTFAWSAVGSGAAAATDAIGLVNTMTRLPLGRFAVAGGFHGAGTLDVRSVALWNGAAWQPFGTGIGNGVTCAATLADGTFVLGGAFAQINGQTCNGIAIRSGAGHAPLGAGLTTQSGQAGVAGAILALPGGGMLVGGNFRYADGLAVGGLAQWSGGTWSPFTNGVDGSVNRILRTRSGDLVVAGSFTLADGMAANNIARWNGTLWSSLGAGLDGIVLGLVELPNGDLLAAGYGLTAFGDVLMSWDGAVWTPMVPPSPSVLLLSAMQLLPGGDLVVGGFDLTSPYGLLSRWNGTSWSPFAANFDGEITALHVRPDGDLVVGGSFTSVDGQPMAGLARLHGGTWQPIDGGLAHGNGGPAVAMIETRTNGNLVVGGFFSSAGGRASSMVAELLVPCAPAVVREGQGCVGAAGTVTLTANTQPWLGSTFTSTATAMPTASIAVIVLGVQPLATPLVQLVPHGGANCFLFVDPLSLAPALPSGGELVVAFAIPAAPALVGQAVREQVVVVELDALGAVQTVTASNALAATLGAW